MVNKALIKQLVDDCEGDLSADKVSEHLYNELKLIEEIKIGIKVANVALNDENKRHEIKKKELNSDIKEFQKKCKHWDKTYHPDASGNNDSCYECMICGEYF